MSKVSNGETKPCYVIRFDDGMYLNDTSEKTIKLREAAYWPSYYDAVDCLFRNSEVRSYRAVRELTRKIHETHTKRDAIRARETTELVDHNNAWKCECNYCESFRDLLA